ncbi:MAG: hypothetical protein U0174_07025 [Polyangiaceae bacterium]
MRQMLFRVSATALMIASISGCGKERAKLSADCTEVGPSGLAHGLDPCLKLAAKYPDKDNGLGVAWSGIQTHCSFDPVLSPSRQKECDNACVMMKTLSAGHSGGPSEGNTYVRVSTGMGECRGGSSGGSSSRGSGSPSKATPLTE